MSHPYSPPSRLVAPDLYQTKVRWGGRPQMPLIKLILIEFSYSPFFFFLIPSRCWMSQTQTARLTAKPHSSIRKTSGSTRRGWRPSWSRAGQTAERLSPLHSFLSSPSLHHPTTSVFHLYLIEGRKKKHQIYQNSSATLIKGRKKQPNQNGLCPACQYV